MDRQYINALYHWDLVCILCLFLLQFTWHNNNVHSLKRERERDRKETQSPPRMKTVYLQYLHQEIHANWPEKSCICWHGPSSLAKTNGLGAASLNIDTWPVCLCHHCAACLYVCNDIVMAGFTLIALVLKVSPSSSIAHNEDSWRVMPIISVQCFFFL